MTVALAAAAVLELGLGVAQQGFVDLAHALAAAVRVHNQV